MQHYTQFFVDNWLLIVIFLILLIMIIKLEASHGKWALSTSQACLWMNREHAVVLDLREDDAFKKGHLSGAVPIKLEFPEKNSPWTKYKKKKVLLVCEDGRVARRLRDKICSALEHQDVKYLRGGMQSWLNDGLPLES